MRVKITQSVVDRQGFTTSGTRWLHDTELRGFCLAVGMTTRTFYASTEYALLASLVALAGVLFLGEIGDALNSTLMAVDRGLRP